VRREKQRGVGSWQSQSANIGRNCLPWQPTLAARLLENGAKIEPYRVDHKVGQFFFFKESNFQIVRVFCATKFFFLIFDTFKKKN
jgi:hypothetical protein